MQHCRSQSNYLLSGFQLCFGREVLLTFGAVTKFVLLWLSRVPHPALMMFAVWLCLWLPAQSWSCGCYSSTSLPNIAKKVLQRICVKLNTKNVLLLQARVPEELLHDACQWHHWEHKWKYSSTTYHIWIRASPHHAYMHELMHKHARIFCHPCMHMLTAL